MPEAVVALGETKRVAGALRFASDGRRQHSQDWKSMLRAEGASPADLRDYAPAFEHDAVTTACRFDD